MYAMNLFCCVKYFTVFFSCFYWILGSAIIVGSIWILNDPIFSLLFTHSGKILCIAIYFIIFVGCFILLSAWFACYGILKQSKCILGGFIFTLIVIVAIEIASGIWVLRNKDRLEDIIRASAKHSIQEEYGQISTTTVTFDVIQKHLKCCGADGPNDWIASRYNNVGREDILNIAFSSLNAFFNIPESCCNQDMSEITCELGRKHKLDAVFHAGIHDDGCVNKLLKLISTNSDMLVAISLSAIFLEITALLFSLFLCCKFVKKSNKKCRFQDS